MLNLRSVDELISARKTLHGGNPGAPVKVADGTREGAALNRACVVLLSATLQAHVSDVFVSCSSRAFGRQLRDRELDNYRATWNRWGNANPANIIGLFRRLGVDDILAGLSWQGQSTRKLKNNLDHLNQVRNQIAHGEEDLTVDGRPFSLALIRITRWRNVSEKFGEHFEGHALGEFRT